MLLVLQKENYYIRDQTNEAHQLRDFCQHQTRKNLIRTDSLRWLWTIAEHQGRTSGSNIKYKVVGSMEAPSKVFLLFFLLPDWLKLNHLKSRMECGFSDILSRHICSTVEETIGVTNYAAIFARKNVQKTTFEAAEMMLGPWNQQKSNLLVAIS